MLPPGLIDALTAIVGETYVHVDADAGIDGAVNGGDVLAGRGRLQDEALEEVIRGQPVPAGVLEPEAVVSDLEVKPGGELAIEVDADRPEDREEDVDRGLRRQSGNVVFDEGDQRPHQLEHGRQRIHVLAVFLRYFALELPDAGRGQPEGEADHAADDDGDDEIHTSILVILRMKK